MKTTKRILASVLLIIMTVALLSFDLPKGWLKAGDSPDKYDMGIDKGAGQDGKNVATIKSIETTIKGFGTLMQSCKPDKFRGKRVRMSGIMKSKGVSDWAGFWFRVDPNLSFDNMHDGKKDNSVKGTTEWKKYEIVLDVPDNATNLAYGALLSGTGQIWFGNIKFEIVDNSVPTTGLDQDANKNKGERFNQAEPTNLNFDE